MSIRLAGLFITLALVLSLAGCGVENSSSWGEGTGGTQRTVVAQQKSTNPTAVPDASVNAIAEVSPTVSTADCSGVLAGSIEKIGSVEELVWTSHQIVVGTVVEKQPSVWGDGYNPSDASRRLIYTHYTVRVEQRVRGLPGDTIVVRQWGGTIGSCTQTNMLEPSLAVGERVLLFLRRSNPQGSSVTYSLDGGAQGKWLINPNGSVTTNVGHL